MTTTKPTQPATPLPLHYDHVRIFMGVGLVATCESLTMAEEITERHNAYPRLLAERAELVAALRGVLKRLDEIHDPDGAFWSGYPDQENARALLRKLGADNV